MTLIPLKKPKSYLRRKELGDNVKFFDPFKYTVVDTTSTHDRYDCPHCEERRGKIDDDGKLYWDRTKLVGFCFKCNVTVILESDKDINELKLELTLKSFFNSFTEVSGENLILSKIPYYEMFDEVDKEGIDYLNSRVSFYELFIDSLNFRVSPKTGIAVPIIIDDDIISYNLRFYHPKGNMKYFIPTGVKYLYSPTNILNKRNKYSEITLTEGYFSCLGALLDGYKNPICIFGNTMTKFQIALLRKYCPVKITIYLDETALSYKLLKHLKKEFPLCSSYEVVPTNFDPEERFKFRLNRIKTEEEVESLFKTVESVNNVIKENNVAR